MTLRQRALFLAVFGTFWMLMGWLALSRVSANAGLKFAVGGVMYAAALFLVLRASRVDRR